MNLQRRWINDISQERGASRWVSTRRLSDEAGICYDKIAASNLIRIRYQWQLAQFPKSDLLSQICKGVQVEPTL